MQFGWKKTNAACQRLLVSDIFNAVFGRDRHQLMRSDRSDGALFSYLQGKRMCRYSVVMSFGKDVSA